MFVTRLRQLAASKCDDLALALASAVMDRVRACRPPPRDCDAPDQPKGTVYNRGIFVLYVVVVALRVLSIHLYAQIAGFFIYLYVLS